MHPLFPSIQFNCASDALRSGVYILLFILLSDLSSTERAHIHWFADGTILPYMLVDLLSLIKSAFFFSALKCTRKYGGVISIIEAILDKTQGCLLIDLLVSISLASGCNLQHPSLCDAEKGWSCCYWQDCCRKIAVRFIHALLWDSVILKSVSKIREYRIKDANYRKYVGKCYMETFIWKSKHIYCCLCTCRKKKKNPVQHTGTNSVFQKKGTH